MFKKSNQNISMCQQARALGRQKLIFWSGSNLQPANHPPTDLMSFWFFIFATLS